jgi:hypothetical protein
MTEVAEFNKVQETNDIFTDDDTYKPIELFREQLPTLPDHVHWILYLRYNRKLLTEDEIKLAELTLERLKNNTRKENEYYQKLFEENIDNTIDCSVEKADDSIPHDNEVINIGFH